MPIITKIVQQKRRSSRFSVYVDGRYSFALSDLDLSNSGLREGREVAAADLQEFKDSAELGKAKDAVYSLLSYRPRSRREIIDYLKRKEWSAEVIDKVVSDLEGADLINDLRFAKDWVEHRQLLSPRSNRKLWAELMSKGIEREIIDEALEGAHDPVATIKEVVEHKRLHFRYPDRQKLIAYLGGQGFSYADIKKALDDSA